jgi:hypothetical protein
MLIEAQVILLKHCSTALGQRLYAVFETIDGRQLGVWVPADCAAVSLLRVGDTVSLKRDTQGRLHLAPQPLSYATNLGIFALLKNLWRLV